MDPEEIKESIKERFNNLQPEVQAAIMSSDYEKSLYKIYEKYHLTIEQMGQLEFNTTLVLLGQTHPDDFAEELEEDLKLPKEKVAEIVTDLNELVFKNIREILKSNFDKEDAEEKEFNAVPEPPYKPKEPEVPTPPQTTSNILGNAGIEMIQNKVQETPKMDTSLQKEEIVLGKSGVDVIQEPKKEETQPAATPVERKEILSGIENPATLSSSLIGQKLAQPITTPTVSTDYSLTKNQQPSTQTPSHDQYREVVE